MAVGRYGDDRRLSHGVGNRDGLALGIPVAIARNRDDPGRHRRALVVRDAVSPYREEQPESQRDHAGAGRRGRHRPGAVLIRVIHVLHLYRLLVREGPTNSLSGREVVRPAGKIVESPGSGEKSPRPPYTPPAMTLRTRIVAALVLAALIPMAVVLAVSLAQAEKRADDVTRQRLELARTAGHDPPRLRARAVPRRSRPCGVRRSPRTTPLRPRCCEGPESVARPVASALAERYVLDRVEILERLGHPVGRRRAGSGSKATRSRSWSGEASRPRARR